MRVSRASRLPAVAIALAIALVVTLTSAPNASAALPRPVTRAFLDENIPLSAVSAYVREVGAPQAAFSLQPTKPMNPASTMKLVTTFAGLELLGRDYRWKTEAYADGAIAGGVLEGNLVLKGYGDPKITIEQFQALIAHIRATGLTTIRGDLVLDRSFFATVEHDPAAFDAEPLKPYNVGPDALLVNFKSVRFVFAPGTTGSAAEVRSEPALPGLSIRGAPGLSSGECGDWRSALRASFVSRGDAAEAVFGGKYPADCGERDWYVALFDHPHYVLGMFQRYWADAGGTFAGSVRDGRVRPGAVPLAILESPPLYDVVRDINKLSNNLMARQLFLTLATTAYSPPATTAHAASAIDRWLASRKLSFPELVLENGSGLSRRERIAAQSMARLLLAASVSPVASEFVSSLAVAATDGTVRKRFQRRRRRRLGVSQDRHAGRRARARRLRLRGQRQAVRDRVHGQSPERRARAAGAGSARAVDLSERRLAALMLWLDWLAESKIDAAIRAGEFDHLPGTGAPLALDDDSLVAPELRMAHRILKNAGFVPPEIEARREITELRALIARLDGDDERQRAAARGLAPRAARIPARGLGSAPPGSATARTTVGCSSVLAAVSRVPPTRPSRAPACCR